MLKQAARLMLALTLVRSVLALEQGATQRMESMPAAPQFPSSYEMVYDFILPYTYTFQSSGLKYPVHLWYDEASRSTRIEVYDGMDAIYSVPGMTYNIYPRITTKVCDAQNTTVGPTSEGIEDEGPAPPPLPDIRRWEYGGQVKVRNIDAYMWRVSEKHYEKVNTYIFYTAVKTGWPLKLQMMGVNLMTGSHYDEYLLEFTLFRPGPIMPSAFALPKLCKDAPSRQQQGPTGKQQQQQGSLLHRQLRSLLPSAAMLDRLTAAATAAGAQVAAPVPQQASALSAAFLANKAFVEDFNLRRAPQLGYRLALNRFAHMSHEDFVATMLGRQPRRTTEASVSPDASVVGGRKAAAGAGVRGRLRANLGTYQRVLRDDELPKNVDYRGTGADGPVLDQASCGSCWAFAAAGVMQSAWFKATGQAALFSEQQLVDCSWDYGNNGCNGGEMEPAIQYVVDHGGIALAEEYQYLGQNGFCKHNTTGRTNRGIFRGFKNVPAYDELALMEALYLHGPVAISFNAALPPFKFYSEGVYYNPECHTDEDHLDHAVLLVGYGTTDDGVDYWILKNSWSTYWGANGYAKMARKGNDCGITADPVMAVVDDEVAARFRAQRADAKSVYWDSVHERDAW